MKNKTATKKLLRTLLAALQRWEQTLPPPPAQTDWRALAYRWQADGSGGMLSALPDPHTFPLERLAAVGRQTEQLVRNTEQFLRGRPANNMLLSMLDTSCSSILRIPNTTAATMVPVIEPRPPKTTIIKILIVLVKE